MLRLAALIAALGLAGCQTTGTGTAAFAGASPVMKICSGFGCKHSDALRLTETDLDALDAIMAEGAASPQAEREAVRRAVAFHERLAHRRLRMKPDVERAYQRNRGIRGQMDCVDESLNTLSLLKLLHARGTLRHHVPARRFAERGLLIDGRYPHKSATMRERGGTRWAVDSWAQPTGGLPTIKPYAQWRKDVVAD